MHKGKISVEAHATTGAAATFSIATEVGGRFVWVNPDMKEGKKIERGVRMFKIDPTDYQLQVQ